ncbi:hypothetical protein LTR56_025221 [Elasticomyces elasticus]|nr:hypothetical protein LTR56_025221 [Elasticomyces elasticus]KAK3637304.1 hypothetical protein LTR22_018338 [Elasticomyces elasticus]KAK4916424.1 hypothetical protein LTR49_015522 [Elasticomyces elasticus]KAK5756030.1 hypothetical protein LTS12_013919 [Elasticomyces elasticus]
MSDKDRDEDPQINDEQAIKIIRDRNIRKMLRNASGPNYFTKKGELYGDVRYVVKLENAADHQALISSLIFLNGASDDLKNNSYSQFKFGHYSCCTVLDSMERPEVHVGGDL